LKNAVGIGIFALSGVIATGVSPLQVVLFYSPTPPPFLPYVAPRFPHMSEINYLF
jgi:hypothetical protein